MNIENAPKKRASSVRPLIAGWAYGAFEAVLPPIGELEISSLIHLSLVTAFVIWVATAFRAPQRMVALTSYVVILGISIVLPFKLFDERLQLPTTRLELAELPSLIQAAGYPLRVRDPLPSHAVLRLSKSAPSLHELDRALIQQTGYHLRRMPVCGNAVSLSFLWGPRVSRPHLMLVATELAATHSYPLPFEPEAGQIAMGVR